MAETLTFMMGKFAAVLPGELRYARNHMWCRYDGALARFGFTSYAVRLMQDVYFLDWHVSPPAAVRARQLIGHIETSKAVSDLFAPLSGTLLRFNDDVLKDPSAINVDNYGAGWLFEMTETDADTLSAQEYFNFLDANWEKTQNMLKGHM
ncbi:MAG: glycine cleavage system protein H [Gemmataceae bacterium]|nr:glycine cleavage system protein H [Gemmataceae bacterium]